jgi:putative hemolysin
MNKLSLEAFIKNLSELGIKSICTIMTSVSNISFLDINDSREELLNKILKSRRTFYPVCSERPENVIGIIHIKDLLIESLTNSEIDIKEALHEPVYFSETHSIRQAYNIFVQSKTGAAFVVNKSNDITGFITLRDITKALLKSFPSPKNFYELFYEKKTDESWVIDGLIPAVEFQKAFTAVPLPEIRNGENYTLGAFIVNYMERVPAINEKIDFGNYSFEILNSDVEKIYEFLLRKIS